MTVILVNCLTKVINYCRHFAYYSTSVVYELLVAIYIKRIGNTCHLRLVSDSSLVNYESDYYRYVSQFPTAAVFCHSVTAVARERGPVLSDPALVNNARDADAADVIM